MSTLGAIDRALERLTLFSARNRVAVLLAALVVAGLAWTYASGLRVKGSFVELLPTESPTAKRFRNTLARKGGSGSTLLVIAEGPDAGANQRFIDAVEKRIEALPKSMVASVEHGPEDARAFFEEWRWLFASVEDLTRVECELDKEWRSRLPGYLDIDDPCPGTEGELDDLDEKQGERAAASEKKRKKDDRSPLARLDAEVKKRVRDVDRFPTGYFRNESGTVYVLLVRSPRAGMGELSSDELLTKVEGIVAGVNASSFHPEMQVGLGGDIPNAVAERRALVADVALVSFIAVSLILLTIVVFFRSPMALVHIGVCVGTGCGLAFAIAMAAYGHLNTATSFLGSIIAGNGINYGIVYLGRYRERRLHGDDVETALVDAAITCRKGTWLAALAASGAYAALLLTSFRGFSEFGLIGGTGMVLCWLCTFTVIPASISLSERLLRQRKATAAKPRRVGVMGRLAAFSAGAPVAVLLVAAVVSVAAAVPLPGYLSDPWEYNFAKLKSKKTSKTGAGHWSKKANAVFGSRGSPMLVLADDADGALKLAEHVKQRDSEVTGGTFVKRVETIHDRLGGTKDEVKQKLALLEKIRKHIDKMLPRMKDDDAKIARNWRPPEYLRPLTAKDLPELVRQRYVEENGRVGTPVYVYLQPGISQSRGENLLKITDVLEGLKLPDGSIAPNASRATVFAAMIRSMERDGPRATLAAFIVVVAVALIVTRRALPAIAVIGSLLCGVLWTVGGAAWLDVRLNFLNFVALPLTFGIGVEYAINLYERVRVTGSIVDGIASAGGAVFVCSLTTILGYGSLIFADNRALQSFGRYAIAGEIACIITALLVMPAALALRARTRSDAAAVSTR